MWLKSISFSRSGVRVIEVATKSSLPSFSIGMRSALDSDTVSTATPRRLATACTMSMS